MAPARSRTNPWLVLGLVAGLAVMAAASAGAEQEAYHEQAAEAPPSDSIAELERLARLHESGALTDQEFAAAKARALGL